MRNRVAVLIVLGAVAVAGMAALVWWLLARPAPAPGAPQDEEVVPGTSVTFRLYFPGGGGVLVPEERELAVTTDPESRARAIVLALLDGPRDPALHRPFPEEVVLRELYLEANGTTYVDLGQEGTDG